MIVYNRKKLFYVKQDGMTYKVMHRQLCGVDRECAIFNFDFSVSKTRALRASKVFCNTMNNYYPEQPKWK